jgi:hypothetical protein
MMSRVAAVAAAVSVAVALGACGSGGSSSTSVGSSTSSSSTSASVTRQDYVKQVTARCHSYLRDRAAAAKPVQALLTQNDPAKIPSEQLKAAAGKIAALDATTISVIDDLEALPRPQADAAELQSAFAKLDQAKAGFQQGDAAASQGNGQAMASAYQKADEALRSLGPLSKKFGFNVCG